MYQFIKYVLDNKMSIFEEYGAFKWKSNIIIIIIIIIMLVGPQQLFFPFRMSRWVLIHLDINDSNADSSFTTVADSNSFLSP